jgi:hypothetical protein
MLFGGQEMKIFEIFRNANSSVLGLFLRIDFLTQSEAVVLGILASVAIGIAGLFIAARVDRLGYRVCALVTLLCTSVLVSPIAWDHYFTFVPLLVFVIMEVGLNSAAGRVAVVALAIFTFPWFDFIDVPIHPSLGQEIVAGVSRNALFVAALLIFVIGILAARPARGGDRIPAAQVADSVSAQAGHDQLTSIVPDAGPGGPEGRTAGALHPDPQPSG